jgi:hypothetical protein
VSHGPSKESLGAESLATRRHGLERSTYIRLPVLSYPCPSLFPLRRLRSVFRSPFAPLPLFSLLHASTPNRTLCSPRVWREQPGQAQADLRMWPRIRSTRHALTLIFVAAVYPIRLSFLPALSPSSTSTGRQAPPHLRQPRLLLSCTYRSPALSQYISSRDFPSGPSVSERPASDPPPPLVPESRLRRISVWHLLCIPAPLFLTHYTAPLPCIRLFFQPSRTKVSYSPHLRMSSLTSYSARSSSLP